MTRNHIRTLAGALGLALLLGGTALWAQHAISSKFDKKKPMELSGVVTKLDWRNPQAHIFVNVTKAGKVENWAVEIEGPSLLEMDGWTDKALAPGDRVSVKGIQARNGSRQVWGEEVHKGDSKGALLFTPKPVVARAGKAKAAPRWPDGHPALGALPGSADGFWTDPSKTVLIEDGVTVAVDKYGLLVNIADAAKVAPMQPWALAVYRNRQQRELQEDPLFLNCKPPGGPRQFQSRLGFQLMEDQSHKRVFVLMGSGNHNYRIIYLDGRKQVGLKGGDDDNPLYFGRSAGRWDGDTLVVDVIGFNEDFWFSQGGLPHTNQLHLIERYTRVDQDTLRYQVEIDDPGAYTRKWSASWTLKWNEGGTLPSHFCQNNRQ